MGLSEPLLGGDELAAKKASWQKVVFVMTFTNYAMSHFSRKCYTNVKTDMKAAGVDEIILSQMDTAFMFTYALGSFATGRLADMLPQNAVIGYGLLGSTVCLALLVWFIMSEVAIWNYPLGFTAFVGANFIHGLFQATGGPVNTSVMGNWFPKKGRGLIFGLWTCHQYIGDIISAVATVLIIKAGLAWQWALVIPGLANGVQGLLNFHLLPNTPAEAGCDMEAKTVTAGSTATPPASAISFKQALMIPNVMAYSLAFGFFKFVNYCMFFWLPFFLSIHFDANSANLISTLYSVGMMPGGVIVGFVSDLYDGRRACVIATFMVILAPLLWVFAIYSDVMPPSLLLVLLGLMGVLVGGPNNIITSAVAADLAEHPSIGGNSRSLGTVTGIINGSGSITAAIGLIFIGPLQSIGGWAAVWYFLIACVLTGTALMGPKISKELFDHQSTK